MALMLAGGLLLLIQLHGYQHSKYADDFPMNQDDHHHTHAGMKRESSPWSNHPKKFDINNTIPPDIVPKSEGK